jgi:hypothetical protein
MQRLTFSCPACGQGDRSICGSSIGIRAPRHPFAVVSAVLAASAVRAAGDADR